MEKNKTSLFSKMKNNRNLKYGSLAVTLTVLLVALIIIFNAAIYAITYSFGWYIDLTGEREYGITDYSYQLLDGVLTSDVQVQIIFCQEKDRILDNAQGFFIYKCIETYQRRFPDNIKVTFLDINKHPELVSEYTTQHDISLRSYNIIMESNKSSIPRVLDYDNFFTYDSESQQIYAFKGELCFTSYIISLCEEAPICYFTEGHGEKITDGAGNKPAIWEMLEDVGFDVRSIDLRQTEATLDDAKIIVINSPTYDFERNTELQKIRRFMADQMGNALVFLSPEIMTTTDSKKELVNFKSFLAEWGVAVEKGIVIDGNNSMVGSGDTSIMADYPMRNEGDFAASLHDYIRQSDNPPPTVIDNALAFTCTWADKGDENTALGRSYDPVLYSHNGATLNDKSGQHAIAVLVKSTKYIAEQPVKNYMFVTSEGYVASNYLASSEFANRDIIYMLADQMSKKLIPVGIDIKPFDSEALTISTGMAYFWTILFTAVLPTCVIVTGTVICYRRKRS